MDVSCILLGFKIAQFLLTISLPRSETQKRTGGTDIYHFLMLKESHVCRIKLLKFGEKGVVCKQYSFKPRF
jgi:hypothetical protein